MPQFEQLSLDEVRYTAKRGRRRGETGGNGKPNGAGDLGFEAKLWLAAAAGAGVGWAIKLAIGGHHPVIIAALVLIPYGLIYFAVTAALRVPELNTVLGRVMKFAGRGR